MEAQGRGVTEQGAQRLLKGRRRFNLREKPAAGLKQQLLEAGQGGGQIILPSAGGGDQQPPAIT